MYHKRNYYRVLVAAVILVALLMSSFFNNTQLVNKNTDSSVLTIEKGYTTTNNLTVNLTHMTKWYYFDKNKLNEQDLAIVEPFIPKLYESTMYIDEYPQDPFAQLLLVMSDERVAQLAVLSYNDQYVLVDMNTKQSLPITIDEAMDIELMIYFSADRSLFGLIALILYFFLLVLYINIVLQISPQKKEKLEAKKGRFYFLAVFRIYIVYTFVSGLSLYYFDSYNGLFIASVMALLLLLKTFIEYYNGRFERSIYEIPLFFVFVLLFTLVKFL